MTRRVLEEVRLQGSALADEFEITATPLGQNLILEGNAGEDRFAVYTGQLRSRIDIDGGLPIHNDLPAGSQGDILELFGDGDDVGEYHPGDWSDRGRIPVNDHIVSFTGIEPVYRS